jgi:hypothetical protein
MAQASGVCGLFREAILCQVDLLSGFYVMENLLVHRPLTKRVLPPTGSWLLLSNELQRALPMREVPETEYL